MSQDKKPDTIEKIVQDFRAKVETMVEKRRRKGETVVVESEAKPASPSNVDDLE